MARKFTIISENFNGGENNSADATALADNQLQRGENCRLSLMGGFTMRPGYEEASLATFVGTNAFQGGFATDYGIFFVDNGKVYLTLENVSDAFEVASGLDTTAKCRFLEYNEDIFIMNGVDHPMRLAKALSTTDLTVGVSVSLGVSVGQGGKYGATGTVVVFSSLGSSNVAYTNRVNDTFTITPATVDLAHTIGAIAIEATVLTNAPIGSFGTVFQNTWFMGGVKPKDSTQAYNKAQVHYSVGATGLTPEGFYDFTGVGAGAALVDQGGEVTCLVNTKSYLLIGKKDRVIYCSGFDSGNDLIMGLITDIYGVAGPDCATTIGRDVVVFTGSAVKRIGEQEGLNNTVPSLDATFDAAFSKYLTKELAEDQSGATFSYNAKEELAKLWITKKNGIKECIVIDNKMNPVTQERRNAWTRDTNKPASQAIVYKNRTYWFSDVEPKMFRDEYGYSDNGFDISMVVRGPDFNLKKPRESKYFATHYVGGLIYTGAIVEINYYFDNLLVATEVLTDSLISADTSESLGTTTIATVSIGGDVTYETLEGKEFEIEKLLIKRRDTGKISIEYVCQGQAQIFEIKSQQISGIVGDKFNKKVKI